MMQRLLQFTLDLFERSANEEPRARLAGPLTVKQPVQRRGQSKTDPKKEPYRVLAEAEYKTIAIESIAMQSLSGGALPTLTLQQALAPGTFRHPHAAREALLGGVLVAYAFRRGKRRTIGFTVGLDGLAVSAPSWVPLLEVDKAVREKSDWILKKLKETRARGQRLDASRIDWADGCTLVFLGQPLTVVLDARQMLRGAGAEFQTAATGHAGGGACLLVGLPRTASPDQIKDAVKAWLMQQARQIFLERLTHFAPIV
ncbi:MAG: DUF45 domain-containing protein, partial [Polaromonas sp.]|nr:DUF45 domain-containing protein [Polaromonas sp.]